MKKSNRQAQSISALRNFSAGLIALAEQAPRNLTTAQLAFFMTAALADEAGVASTFTDIKEAVGPAVGRTLHTTYKVFLSEGRLREGQRIEGLGWLELEVDPTDNRRKFLRLTKKGRRVIDAVAAEINYGA